MNEFEKALFELWFKAQGKKQEVQQQYQKDRTDLIVAAHKKGKEIGVEMLQTYSTI